MAREDNKKLSVFSDVIKSLTLDAAMGVEGAVVLRASDGQRRGMRSGNVSVEFLPNEKVSIDLSINIHYGFTVPAVVASVQEKVKIEVESSTKYRVHSVNVHVKDVLVQ
jgi:uncharacterized alkaline shock family protein YloU